MEMVVSTLGGFVLLAIVLFGMYKLREKYKRKGSGKKGFGGSVEPGKPKDAQR